MKWRGRSYNIISASSSLQHNPMPRLAFYEFDNIPGAPVIKAGVLDIMFYFGTIDYFPLWRITGLIGVSPFDIMPSFNAIKVSE